MTVPIKNIKSRLCFNSRGSPTIEIDVFTDGGFGRSASPSGASVGAYESKSFPSGGVIDSIKAVDLIKPNLIGADASNIAEISSIIKNFDNTQNYENIGGSAAYAISFASIEAASKELSVPLFKLINPDVDVKIPHLLGNVIGGGKHSGAGSFDIQEFLACPVGAKTINDSLSAVFEVHAEVKRIIEDNGYPSTLGKGDEGAWAPSITNDAAFNIACSAINTVSDNLGFKIRLGVDFAASSFWNSSDLVYEYSNSKSIKSVEEQSNYVEDCIQKYDLIYVEDPFHEDAFEEFASLTKNTKNTYVVGDDLLVTNPKRLELASSINAVDAAILKVNQIGTLGDALLFAKQANIIGCDLITSHRSGDTSDSHISHVALATGSIMLKSGVVGGERVAKLNELLRINETLNGVNMSQLR